jgi:hypothetical protein
MKTATGRARASSGATATRWTKRVERLEKSGLSIRVFAAREGISPGSLSHWKWRLEHQSRAASGAPRFIELKTPSAADSGVTVLPFEVVLVSGRVIRVRRGFDAAELGRLVGVLEEARS